jgi:surface polysaccharide O-acyltransferase-like enzyme
MNEKKQPTFLGYLHSFRGFAIINIVAIHAFSYALYDFNHQRIDLASPFRIANELLFHDSTIYFAVISGLLFSVVLKSKGYKRFFNSKLKNVLFPYLFLTLCFSIFNPVFDPPVFIPFQLQSDFASYLSAAFYNFIFGTAQFTYWYIPVLIFLYLVTPLLDYLMNIKKWGTLFMLIIIALPIAISRVELIDMEEYQLSLSTMIYFTGAYAAGIYFGTDPEKWFSWVKKNMLLFVLIALISSVALVYFQIKEINKFGGWSLMSALYYIQKMSLSGIIIVLFKNMGDRQPRWLNPIASYAFVIYFLHASFLDLIAEPIKPLSTMHEIAPLNLFISALFYLVLSIVLSMLIGRVFRKLFGKSSKMLVGV